MRFLPWFLRRFQVRWVRKVQLPAPGEDGRYWALDLVKEAGCAVNTNQAKRLVEFGLVSFDGEVTTDWRTRLDVFAPIRMTVGGLAFWAIPGRRS